MLYSLPYRKLIRITAVSFFLSPLLSYTQTKDDVGALFILKGNTKLMSGKGLEGVDMELKKDGKTISKIVSGKNGKYYMQMDISGTNAKSEYMLYITKEGTAPKVLSINTYIPQKEIRGARYDYALEVFMLETTVKDIVIEKASGNIHWDSPSSSFKFDQVYAKVTQKEIDENEKKRREEEIAKKKAEEEARLKAEADARAKADADARARADAETKRLADQKAKDEADRIVKENLEAMKQTMMKKRMQDSLDSLAALTTSKTKIEINKMSRPVSPDDVDQNAFDGTGAYSINIAKKILKARQERANKEKAKNLSAKYETNNTLTSLLDMVDEHDKKMKKQ